MLAPGKKASIECGGGGSSSGYGTYPKGYTSREEKKKLGSWKLTTY